MLDGKTTLFVHFGKDQPKALEQCNATWSQGRPQVNDMDLLQRMTYNTNTLTFLPQDFKYIWGYY